MKVRVYLICWVVVLSLSNLAIGQSPLRTMKYSSRPKQQAVEWQKELRTELFRISKLEDLVAGKTLISFPSSFRYCS